MNPDDLCKVGKCGTDQKCQFTEDPCDDGLDCTQDQCNATSGCVHFYQPGTPCGGCDTDGDATRCAGLDTNACDQRKCVTCPEATGAYDGFVCPGSKPLGGSISIRGGLK